MHNHFSPLQDVEHSSQILGVLYVSFGYCKIGVEGKNKTKRFTFEDEFE